MEFGKIKSKIDEVLSQSYIKGTFKDEINRFKKIVLEYKDVAQIYNLYHELSTKKGLSEQYAKEYLNECINVHNNLKISKFSLFLLEKWLGNKKVENKYKDIDTLFNKKNTLIESIIESKNNILKTITAKEEVKEHVNVPISNLVEVANNTFNTYLSNLSEEDNQKVKKYLTMTEDEIKVRYDVVSEMVIDKLTTLKETAASDEITSTISETIERIKTEEPNLTNLVKLASLNSDL
jgi:hypothetical protein